jgi:hypothetical protein
MPFILKNVVSLPSGGPEIEYLLGIPTVRSSSIQLVNGSSATVLLPAGAQAGDYTLLFAGHAYTPGVPTGWTNLLNAGLANWGSLVCAKYLTAADVASGSVTVTFSGSYNGVVACASIVGYGIISCPTSGFFSSQNIAGSPSLTNTLPIGVTDLVILFGCARTTGTASINVGAPLQQAADSVAAAGALNVYTPSSTGTVAATFTYTGTVVAGNADSQAIVTLRSQVAGILDRSQCYYSKCFAGSLDGGGLPQQDPLFFRIIRLTKEWDNVLDPEAEYTIIPGTTTAAEANVIAGAIMIERDARGMLGNQQPSLLPTKAIVFIGM